MNDPWPILLAIVAMTHVARHVVLLWNRAQFDAIAMARSEEGFHDQCVSRYPIHHGKMD